MNKLAWALTGHNRTTPLEDHELETVMTDAFMPNVKYRIAIDSIVMPNTQYTLEEVEKGYFEAKEKSEILAHTFGIVFEHEKGSFIFTPIEDTKDM